MPNNCVKLPPDAAGAGAGDGAEKSGSEYAGEAGGAGAGGGAANEGSGYDGYAGAGACGGGAENDGSAWEGAVAAAGFSLSVPNICVKLPG